MARQPSLRVRARKYFRQTQPLAAAPQRRSLTERVRALYEELVVPVREIAALAGVTERAIYRCANRHAWTPRVVRFAREASGVPEARKPDPREALNDAAQAAERCAEAQARADAALAQAEAEARQRVARRAAEREAKAIARACETLGTALVEAARVQHAATAGSRTDRLARRLAAMICERFVQVISLRDLSSSPDAALSRDSSAADC